MEEHFVTMGMSEPRWNEGKRRRGWGLRQLQLEIVSLSTYLQVGHYSISSQ